MADHAGRPAAGAGRGEGVAAIEAEGLCAGYHGVDAVADAHLRIPAGELVALVGPNGAGKSTLLKLIMGLIRPRCGRIRIGGRAPGQARGAGDVAYMPQHETLDWDFPASVRDVIFSARYPSLRRSGVQRWLPRRLLGAEHHEAVAEALSATAMAELADRHISELSGGQKKRVLLARALAQQARLLLLDEPLVGVDRSSEALIFEVLRDLRAAGRTVVLVTHDIAGARRHADRLVLFNRSVIASGPPEEVMTDERSLLRAADPLFARGLQEAD
ncbi:metal ABC transporter ATP-binding protein [Halorhodospira sp. 9621]|uniref:metal ABC transporter ATP-binding protein n=2 Tax=Ectothiorhodospiraceae TaxID=72276 RepID=UPI001911AFEC|nr:MULTISPECIES: metal ABC transporter ATP-binding protein [Halorhodospira]MBK5936659.1 ABC transporter [Halorhodospira halophila]MCG5527394.1 metal ABC transporter ATP-binding protein [Halorhodospira halophila]MCG5532886.1 metal ABC transporter ATP-binding protein [Halorhodospira sp. 9621]MCG5538472.1 metal ABC transporter ATP-binding protein [Halorhodospira sp. 9622]MCG5543612.1 metal ABC transporter ATP-binding protein [Halorhodospira sp. 9628]